jgi:copper resistance protein C
VTAGAGRAEPAVLDTLSGMLPAKTRRAAALLLAVLAVLVAAIPVAAHAELTETDPADGSEVPGPFDGPIRLSFSEDLAESSHAELLDSSGDEVANAEIPADAPDQLVFDLPEPLPAGAYRVQITAIAGDGHVERPIVSFTVLEPEPTPELTPSATARPSDAPTPAPTPSGTAAPSPSPTPSGDGTPVASASDLLFPILAAVIAIAVLGVVLLRNRRATR